MVRDVRHRSLQSHGPVVTFVLGDIDFGGIHKEIQEVGTRQLSP